MLLFMNAPPVDGALVAVVDADGQARGHGAVHIRDGASHTILIAEGPAQATCGDADGDGRAGLTRLSFELREVRGGARLIAEATPVAGDIEKSGRVKVKFPSLRADGDPLEVGAWVHVEEFSGPARALAGDDATASALLTAPR